MASTTFASGTTISSSWFNDVNSAVYGSTNGQLLIGNTSTGLFTKATLTAGKIGRAHV